MIELVEPLLSGSRRALARMLTGVENEYPGIHDALAALYPHTGQAQIIGVTGPPGSGKSTLVTELAKAYRAAGKTVGILAVDPTSPFSGGAILGDRIRMRDLSGDTGVFIRSMATRGTLGGLARAARDAVRVLDAAGLNVILIETVGAGQSEVEIARTAQTTLVVEAPGMGDDVQAIKAGILEIADIIVINKADRPGVENTTRGLKAMLELGHPQRGQFNSHHGRLLAAAEPAPAPAHDDAFWLTPIVQTVASEGKGIDELIATIARHAEHRASSAETQQIERQRLEMELIERLRDRLMQQLLAQVPQSTLQETLNAVQARSTTPQQAVEALLRYQKVP